MERIALYPGSFDPVTVGHADLIERGLKLFDKIYVGIAINIKKRPVFDFDDRAAFINTLFPDDRVEVVTLDGLLVEEGKRLGCQAILRGIRTASDFDYEFRMTSMNSKLAPELETVFLMSTPENLFISSSLVKEVAKFGGDITPYVPPHVAQPLIERLAARSS